MTLLIRPFWSGLRIDPGIQGGPWTTSERIYQTSTDEGADKEAVRTDINEKLQRGWRLVSMVPGIGSASTALWVVVAVLGIVACMLLVYAGAVLLARLVLWAAYYP